VSDFSLYGYWRSSSSWRVRWGLELKKVPYSYVPINLLNGEHKTAAHLARNPAAQVPVLEHQGKFLTESMAILDYLDQLFPNQAINLYSNDPWQRAKIIELCEIINAATAPLQIPKVQKRHSPDPTEQKKWAQEWIMSGLTAFDKIRPQGLYAYGDKITAADLFLIPQIYNALRYEVNVSRDFSLLHKIYETCLATDACKKASPEMQIDATKS